MSKKGGKVEGTQDLRIPTFLVSELEQAGRVTEIEIR